MSLLLASEIVRVFGPRRVLCVGGADDGLLRELLLLGCDAWAAGGAEGATDPRFVPADDLEALGALQAAVLVLDLRRSDGVAFGAQLQRLNAACGLVLLTSPRDPPAHRAELRAGGWIRHPAEAVRTGDVPEAAYYRRPLGGPEAQAHDHGPQAGRLVPTDASLARYALAAHLVRPGDRVLCVGAHGAPDGTAVLGALARAGSVDSVVLAQARLSPSGSAAPPDSQGAALLDGVADHTVDTVVALELELPPPSWPPLFDEVARVLKPDGRLVAGVRETPDLDPTDDAAFEWIPFADAVRRCLVLEARFVEREGGASPTRTPLDAVQAGRSIAVASADPLAADATTSPFRHPAFGEEHGRPEAVRIGAAYDNPYLYRVMVQMGERLMDDDLLAALAGYVADHARSGSPDQGAAVAVLGYRVLEGRRVGDVPRTQGLISSFLAASQGDAAPHVARWRVSLHFLAGRLAELAGDRSGAIAAYRAAAGDEWRLFSPLLATKAVAASFFEARQHLADDDVAKARAAFSRGVRHAIAAAGSPPETFVGDPDRPVPFALQEMAEVMDMGSQCANALVNLPLWERDRGLYWRQVDVRRFGLASWARDVERENSRLRGGPR